MTDKKPLSCPFSDKVLCSYLKYEGSGIMSRCFKCAHYLRFVREMDDDDERMMEKMDEIHRTGVWVE